jgi:hypothetical protein
VRRHASPSNVANIGASIGATVDAGSHATIPRERYSRERDLPRLIRLWPGEVTSREPAMLVSIVRKLHAALRAERQRGLAGHWTYDLARHSQLLAAYRVELQHLKSQREGAHIMARVKHKQASGDQARDQERDPDEQL